MPSSGDDLEIANEEATKEQARALKRANRLAAQNIEDEQCIIKGKEPRAAKKKALEAAAWLVDDSDRKKRNTSKLAEGAVEVAGSANKRKQKHGGDEAAPSVAQKKIKTGKLKGNAVGTKLPNNVDPPVHHHHQHSKKIAPRAPTRPQAAASGIDSELSESDAPQPLRQIRQPRTLMARGPARVDSASSSERSDGNGSNDGEFSDGLEGDEDDGGLGQMSECQIAETLANETPKVLGDSTGLASIWDMDADEVRPRDLPPPRHPRTSASSTSQPMSARSSVSTQPSLPSTQSAARHPSLSSDEDEDEDSELEAQLRRDSRHKERIHSQPKPSSKREQTFRNEHPNIARREPKPAKKAKAAITQPPKYTAEGADDSGASSDGGNFEKRWPAAARLEGDSKLTDQNVYIRVLCRHAISLVETTLVTQHAWPELNRLAEYRNQVLMQALKELKKSDETYLAIRARVKKDDRFVKTIGRWITDRLPHARSPARAKGLDQIAIFQLGVGPNCIERVQELLKNDTYVYPGQWDADESGKPIWVVKKNEIFLNSGLINVLKSAYFATPTSFGHKFKEHYISSHPTRHEPEFPASLVALGATGLYAGLHAWKTGVKAENEKFEGDIFKGVFDRHISYLADVKEKSAIAYHALMSTLYSRVMDGSGNKCAGPVPQANPLALADLSEFV